jgi:hypothetical protein
MSGIAMLDVFIVLAIAGGSLNGLRIGAGRQLISLLILYMSTILTTRFYRLLLPYANRLLSNAPAAIVESVLFMVILLLVFGILSVLILDFAMGQQKERRRTGYNWRRPLDTTGQSLVSTLNHLAGIAVGFVSVCVWISIGLLVYNFLINSPWADWEVHRRRLLGDYQLSSLVPVFRVFLPYVLRTIEPWLPGGLPAMFQLI